MLVGNPLKNTVGKFFFFFVKKGVITQSEQFHIFTQRFLLNLYLKIVLSSAASLNLGPAQNDVLGYGLNRNTKCFHCIEKKKKEI